MALIQGLTFVYVGTLPGVYLKALGAGNGAVGLASLLFLPVAFRFLLGVYVDRVGSKRGWSLLAQAVSSAIAFAGAACVLAEGPLWLTMSLFLAAAVVSAVQDFSIDGFFLFAVTPRQKPFFSSLKVQGYRVGNVIAQGGYVMLSGYLLRKGYAADQAWGNVFLLHAVILTGLMLWNLASFPRDVPGDRPQEAAHGGNPVLWLARLVVDYARQPGMGWLIAYVAFYRLGEAMLAAMKVPFLVDARSEGGLALGFEQVGFMNGVVVFAVLVVGGLAGGAWVARKGLKKTLIPGALLMNLPHAVFFYLALCPPQGTASLFGLEIQPTVQLCLIVEALGYSLGFAPFVYIQIISARGPYRSTLMAMIAGVTNLGWALPGALSGFAQQRMGYEAFFLVITLIGLPVLALIPRMPVDALEKAERENG
jgi:PAT family beta-lactamase induction signal transducer AmpG